jgi:hypothetical protein
MTDQAKPGKHASEGPFGHGTYERRDLGAGGVLYFLLALAVATSISLAGIRGLYALLDRQVRASLPTVSPLRPNLSNQDDTLHIPPGYPQTAFPSPRLEEDERGQLNGIRLNWDNTLYSYGWADQQAGTVRIPIDRAMDLLAQRGLPVRPPDAAAQAADSDYGVGPHDQPGSNGNKDEMK